MKPHEPRTDVLAKMREICLALPDTKLTMPWGSPHFRVGEKIFAGCGAAGGRAAISFKLEMDHAADLVKDPRFTPAPYVGKHGWVQMDVTGDVNWKAVAAFVGESYRLIAPKKSLAKLGGAEVVKPVKKKRPATRKPS